MLSAAATSPPNSSLSFSFVPRACGMAGDSLHQTLTLLLASPALLPRWAPCCWTACCFVSLCGGIVILLITLCAVWTSMILLSCAALRVATQAGLRRRVYLITREMRQRPLSTLHASVTCTSLAVRTQWQLQAVRQRACLLELVPGAFCWLWLADAALASAYAGPLIRRRSPMPRRDSTHMPQDEAPVSPVPRGGGLAGASDDTPTLGNTTEMLPCVEIFDDEDQPQFSGRLGREWHLWGPLEEEEGSMYMAARTLADGACGLHSCWGDVVERGSDDESFVALTEPRAELHRCLEAVSAARLTEMLGLPFSALFETTCCDLARRAREIVLLEERQSEHEVNLVWNALPAHCKEDFLSVEREREQAKERQLLFRDRFLLAADELFQPQYEPLVRQLCLDLTYITEMDMPRLGAVASDVTYDPAELRLFDLFVENFAASASGSSGDDGLNAALSSTHALTLYTALFMERPEADAHRTKFFLQNALPDKRRRVPSVLRNAEDAPPHRHKEFRRGSPSVSKLRRIQIPQGL